MEPEVHTDEGKETQHLCLDRSTCQKITLSPANKKVPQRSEHGEQDSNSPHPWNLRYTQMKALKLRICVLTEDTA